MAAWRLRGQWPAEAGLPAQPDARRAALARRMERLADRMTARQPTSLGPKIGIGRRE
jgi:hypothetical protein